MNEFVEELFDKILSRADLFLVAFEQPIKRNPIDVLRSMQNGNRNRMNKTSEFAVLTDNLYSKLMIISTTLYLDYYFTYQS
jgi:hypothetical protein